MLVFHSFTTCGVLSASRGKGNETARRAWEVCPEVSPKISQYPSIIEIVDLKILEKSVTMHDKHGTTGKINDKPGLVCSEGHAVPFHQQALPSVTMRNGPNPSCLQVGPGPRVQNGNCNPWQLGLDKKMVTSGKFSGQPFHPLFSPVSS